MLLNYDRRQNLLPHRVGGHGEHVGDGERREDEVGGPAHVLAREHDDVEHVGHDAEEADGEGEVAVHSRIVL